MTGLGRQSKDGKTRLMKAGLAALFLASWSGLTVLLVLTLNHLRPAWALGDPASLTAGLLLAPMALYLVQGVWYVPRRPAGRATFIRPRLFRSPLAGLLWPSARDLETGPSLAVVSPPEEREILLTEAAARLAGFTLIPRLSRLLDSRSPLDLLLYDRAAKAPAVLAWPARLIYLIMGPARQFLRLWGYVFFRAWAAWDDPGPVDDLTDYRRRVAFDLECRAATLFPAGEGRPGGATEADLARILAALRRGYNQDDDGRAFAPVTDSRPDGPPAADQGGSLYAEPYLAPRYYGVYLDLPVTLAARTVDDLYDQGGEDPPAIFHPPELGREVVQAALLAAERRRLKALLDSRRVEGLMWLDGRPVPTWRVESAIFDLEDQIAYWRKRVAAHHRRCRSSHLAAARRRGHGWAEALRGLAGLVHFAEHGHRSLSLAAEDFVQAHDLESAAAGLFTVIRDLGDRLTHLDLPPELEVRDRTVAQASSLAAPAGFNLERWLETWPPVAQGLFRILEALKSKALAALLAAEDELDRLDAEGAADTPLAPRMPEPGPGYSIPPRFPVAPDTVYSPAERLRAGFGRTALALLMLALLCWQGQSLGLSRLTAYNGLGREVVVTVDGRPVSLKPFGHGLWRLQPGRVCHVLATADGRPIENFSQELAPLPGAEIYNVAGAAPLMEWRSPNPKAGPDVADGRFLGHPRWLTTRATVLFRDPSPKGEEWVLSGYGDLPPAEILAAFTEERDRLDLIYLHARWDSPLSPWFRDWQALVPAEEAAQILLERVTAEPDFLDRCVRWFEGTSDPGAGGSAVQ